MSAYRDPTPKQRPPNEMLPGQRPPRQRSRWRNREPGSQTGSDIIQRPPVDRQTPVKIFPYPKLRLQAVTSGLKIQWSGKTGSTPLKWTEGGYVIIFYRSTSGTWDVLLSDPLISCPLKRHTSISFRFYHPLISPWQNHNFPAAKKIWSVAWAVVTIFCTQSHGYWWV